MVIVFKESVYAYVSVDHATSGNRCCDIVRVPVVPSFTDRRRAHGRTGVLRNGCGPLGRRG